ncbi:hypothetical protein LQL77_29820 [Rhodococcus cerastii]|nr:hypothetical protein [Rhodococcus cerastii]
MIIARSTPTDLVVTISTAAVLGITVGALLADPLAGLAVLAGTAVLFHLVLSIIILPSR